MCINYVQRYEYYISRGVPNHSLAAQDPEVMERILQKRIPEKLRRNTELDPLVTELKQEVVSDYDFSVRKAIGELHKHMLGKPQLIFRRKLKIFLCSKLTQLFFSISQCFVNTSLTSGSCAYLMKQ